MKVLSFVSIQSKFEYELSETGIEPKIFDLNCQHSTHFTQMKSIAVNENNIGKYILGIFIISHFFYVQFIEFERTVLSSSFSL